RIVDWLTYSQFKLSLSRSLHSFLHFFEIHKEPLLAIDHDLDPDPESDHSKDCSPDPDKIERREYDLVLELTPIIVTVLDSFPEAESGAMTPLVMLVFVR